MSIQLSKNFTSNELECKCCKQCPMKPTFILKLQKMRDLAGVPFNITSGYRCAKHNAAIGGAAKSEHLNGNAVDISLPIGTPYAIRMTLVKAAIEAGMTGVELSDKHIHVDDRATTPVLMLKHLTKTDMF